jgi:hypothetical protein
MKRSKTYVPEEIIPSTKDVLSCLKSESQWLQLLKGRNKPYENLLTDLEMHFDKMFLNGDYNYSVSGLSQKFGIKTPLFVRWVHQIYFDIFELNSYEPELFESDGIRHYLHFSCYGHYAGFTLWLKAPLHQDESFEWLFLKAKLRLSFYFIDKISHEYNNGEQLTSVFLVSGFPNFYQRFIHDKAIFYNKIGLSESFSFQSDLEERLKQLYPQ